MYIPPFLIFFVPYAIVWTVTLAEPRIGVIVPLPYLFIAGAVLAIAAEIWNWVTGAKSANRK